MYVVRKYDDGNEVARCGPFKIDKGILQVSQEANDLLDLENATSIEMFGIVFPLKGCYDKESKTFLLHDEIAKLAVQSPVQNLDLLVLPPVEQKEIFYSQEVFQLMRLSASLCEKLRTKLSRHEETEHQLGAQGNEIYQDAEVGEDEDGEEEVEDGEKSNIYYECFSGNGVLWDFGVFYEIDSNIIVVAFDDFPGDPEVLLSPHSLHREDRKSTSGIHLSVLNSIHEYSLCVNLEEVVRCVMKAMGKKMRMESSSLKSPIILLTGQKLGGCVAQCVYDRYYSLHCHKRDLDGDKNSNSAKIDEEHTKIWKKLKICRTV